MFKNGHNEIVKFLLKNGADINIQNDDKDTALHLAIKENHNEIINELIKCGSNPRLIGYNNKSSIQCAKDAGLNSLVKRLEN